MDLALAAAVPSVRYLAAQVSNRGRPPAIFIAAERDRRSAPPCGVFLLFLLGDGGDDVDHASGTAARKRATGIHQGLVIGKPSMCLRELFWGCPGRDDLCDDLVVEFPQHRGDVFARQSVHGLQPPPLTPSAVRNCAKQVPGPFQPSRSERRTAAAGQCALALITRTRDPFERSTSACEQISSSISATSISVVGSHCNVLGISPGQMRQAEPSLSSTIWLLSCCLICIADLRVIDPSLGCLSGARKPVLRSDYSSDYLAEGRMR